MALRDYASHAIPKEMTRRGLATASDSGGALPIARADFAVSAERRYNDPQ